MLLFSFENPTQQYHSSNWSDEKENEVIDNEELGCSRIYKSLERIRCRCKLCSKIINLELSYRSGVCSND